MMTSGEFTPEPIIEGILSQLDFAELSSFCAIVAENKITPELVTDLCKDQSWFSKVKPLFIGERLHPMIMEMLSKMNSDLNGNVVSNAQDSNETSPLVSDQHKPRVAPEMEGVQYDPDEYLNLVDDSKELYLERVDLAAKVFSSAIEGSLSDLVSRKLIKMDGDTIVIPLAQREMIISRTNGVIRVEFIGEHLPRKNKYTLITKQELIDSITVLKTIASQIQPIEARAVA